MRVAIHQHDEVGMRAGRILLAERTLERLGVVGRRPIPGGDPRIATARDPSGYDVYLSDDVEDPASHARAALAAGASCVLWVSEGDDLAELGSSFAERGLTLLAGANLASGIAPCLAAHEAARSDEVLDVMYAWTEPGKPLRRGEPVPFPDPIGALWARVRAPDAPHRRYVAPVTGEWAGAMAKVTTGTSDGIVARVVGVADLAPHLEALALAAGVLAIGDLPFGLVAPTDRPEAFLAAALDAGLDVAAYEDAA